MSIRHKRKTTSGYTWLNTDLVSGQLGMNLTDGTLHMLTAASTVKTIGANLGTVTSVAVSGGTTGLTTSGGPITSSGTVTLAGTLAIANGGTGQTTATTAITALLPSQTGNSGDVLTTNGTVASWQTPAGAGLGSVSSVSMTVPSFLSVTGSPITTIGTLAVTLASTSQGFVLAGPTSGTGVPSMRAIVAGDIPTLNQNTTGNAATVTTNANLTGDVTSVGNATTYTIVPVTKGGTGQSSVATGDTFYASATNTVSKLTAGSTGQVLTIASGVPTWATPSGGGATGLTATQAMALTMTFGPLI